MKIDNYTLNFHTHLMFTLFMKRVSTLLRSRPIYTGFLLLHHQLVGLDQDTDEIHFKYIPYSAS